MPIKKLGKMWQHFLDTGSNQVSEGFQTGVEVFVLKWLYPLDDFNDKF